MFTGNTSEWVVACAESIYCSHSFIHSFSIYILICTTTVQINNFSKSEMLVICSTNRKTGYNAREKQRCNSIDLVGQAVGQGALPWGDDLTLRPRPGEDPAGREESWRGERSGGGGAFTVNLERHERCPDSSAFSAGFGPAAEAVLSAGAGTVRGLFRKVGGCGARGFRRLTCELTPLWRSSKMFNSGWCLSLH